jgi:hypothetical protein
MQLFICNHRMHVFLLFCIICTLDLFEKQFSKKTCFEQKKIYFFGVESNFFLRTFVCQAEQKHVHIKVYIFICMHVYAFVYVWWFSSFHFSAIIQFSILIVKLKIKRSRENSVRVCVLNTTRKKYCSGFL